MAPGILTTGQVAKICRTTARTVSKWCDTGLLNCYRVPSGKDRRVLPAELAAFMIHHSFPMEWVNEIPLPRSTAQPAASN